ncbi:MAG: heme anaerobic degradation radical SAM methyltransferase ChuW/HutW [Candidatus Desulfofervidaceae bacterium]|nr:heme anaerobic degradation radical SAM methyltransferase ChuW/HutW [Candidatus Desulfofervidaceae bacterium]
MEVEEEDRIGRFNCCPSRLISKAQKYYFAKVTTDPLRFAFNKKVTVHPFIKGLPLKPNEIQATWQRLMHTPPSSFKRTAYFHIPFCETHCLYCGFYRYAYHEKEAERYIEYLIRELKMAADMPFVSAAPIHAVYLGGGTPTALSANLLFKLLHAIKRYLPLANDCEWTVEGRFYHFDKEKVKVCLEAGVNRFSLGVQSFDTQVRQKMGRKLSKEKVIEKLKYLKTFDQAAIIIDLIYGLPYQTMEIWEKDVQPWLDLELDGVDLYQLVVYQGCALEKAVAAKRIPPPADLAEQADMFALGRRILKEAFCRRLSQTHWGYGYRERNAYNLLVTQPSVCLPFGAGAGGWMEGYFFYINNDLKHYYQSLDEGQKPLAMGMQYPPYWLLLKEIESGIEQNACPLAKLSQKYGVDLLKAFSPLLAQWEEAGLIYLENGWLKLTPAGEFWYVNLCQFLFNWFQEMVEGEDEG